MVSASSSTATSAKLERSWKSTSPPFGWCRKAKERQGFTWRKGSGICWAVMARKLEARPKPTFGWLRGRDLNPRPLGYEFDLCFVWFHVVPSVSMTYSILLALGSACFGLLFLRSGSTFGSKPSTNQRRRVLSRHCRSFDRSRATEGQDSRNFRQPNAAIGFPLGLWRNPSPLFTSREGKTLGLSAGSPRRGEDSSDVGATILGILLARPGRNGR